MSEFGATDERLKRVKARMPGFALEPMRLARMIYLVQKKLRDQMNTALHAYDLAESSYMVLAILYGSQDESSSATALSEACKEKPANLTRICDELMARGLITRQPKPGDRRAVMIVLTEEGRTLVEEILPKVSAQAEAAFAAVDASGLRQMAELNLQVLEGLRAAR